MIAASPASSMQARLRMMEADRKRYREALELIVSRHPDASPGEHPAVDIARGALRVEWVGPYTTDDFGLTP